MEVALLILLPFLASLAAAAVVDDWYDRHSKEGQVAEGTYIEHLQAAREIIIKTANSERVNWLQSQKLLAAADKLQDIITNAQRDEKEAEK